MSNDLARTDQFDPAELGKLLSDAGAIDEPAESWNRIKVDGANFVTDGEDAWQTPIRGGGPAFRARIIGQPEQYQAKWFNEADADKAGRPDMANKFCKSRFGVPGEDREYGTNGASCRECIFNPFDSTESFKCGWKGDLRMQVFPDDGELKGDEVEYVLTMSVTGMIEFRGTKRNPNGGSVSEHNFIYQLGQFSLKNAESLWDLDPTTQVGAKQAVMRGLTALNTGRVAVEARSLKAVDEQRGREWYVPSFTPIFIDTSEVAELPSEAGEFDGTGL